MMPDLIEDIIAFVYATQPDKSNTCPVCGGALEENDDGELSCPECGNGSSVHLLNSQNV